MYAEDIISSALRERELLDFLTKEGRKALENVLPVTPYVGIQAP